jgi:hypothetical protein
VRSLIGSVIAVVPWGALVGIIIYFAIKDRADSAPRPYDYERDGI